jgi:hypothetical protein
VAAASPAAADFPVAAVAVAAAEAGRGAMQKNFKASKVRILKIGIALMTIGIMAMNIALVSSYDYGTNNLLPARDDYDTEQESDISQTPVAATDPPDAKDPADSFTAAVLSDAIKARITGKSYSADAEIPYEDLNYIKVLYYDFDGQIQEGELIVNKLAAEDILAIFRELYDKKYPIAKMTLIDAYTPMDEASMADNNTSSFCWRQVSGSEILSMHAYGLAVDINPVMNPMVITDDAGTVIIKPPMGADFLARSSGAAGLIVKGDACYNAFISRGWEWGGEWTTMKDYMHFSKSIPDYIQE